MTARIFAKLLIGAFCLLAVAMAAVDFFATRVVESRYIQNLTADLAEKGRMIDFAFPDRAAGKMLAMAHDVGARLTVIRPDGRVILDSDAEPAKMENHATRPEFMAALAGRMGSTERRSATTGMNYLYVAIPIANGALRLAKPLSGINSQVNSIR